MDSKNRNTVKNKTVIKGFSWAFAERMMVQVSNFLVSIVLARILEPSAYGILALANIFINIMNSIMLTGFGTSLIQKKNADETDFSSVLFFSFFVSIMGYMALFLSAPYMAGFLGNKEITNVIRVASLIIITASVNTVQRAYVTRNMRFELFFVSSIFSSVFSAVIGIYLALKGYGVWALVAQNLSKSCVDIISLAIISDWSPRFVFSWGSIISIYGFGWKIVVSTMLDSVYEQLRSLIIGKRYTSTELAYYEKGLQLPTLLINNVDNTIANVLISVISKVQDNTVAVKNLVRKAVVLSSSLLFPLLLGMMACSQSIIELLLTEKWLPCIPYMRLLCVALMFKPVQTANMQGLLAIGKSDIYLKIKTLQKIIGIIIIIITVAFFDSPKIIAAGEVVAYMLFWIVMIGPNIKYIHYTFYEQITDLLPQLFCSVIMCSVVSLVKGFHMNCFVELVIQVLLGGVVYIILSIVFKLQYILYIREMYI